MNTTLTPHQLLQQNPGQAEIKPVSRIKADLPLEGKILGQVIAMLSNPLIQGMEVVTPDGQVLGFLSRQAISSYISSQLHSRISQEGRMGGGVSTLPGRFISEAPLFRCNLHTPPDQILGELDDPILLKCSICGTLMQRVE